MNVSDAINEYLIYLLSEKGLSEKTYEAYSRDLALFRALFGKKEIEDLSEKDYSLYHQKLSEKGYTSSTITRKLTSLRCFLSYLTREKGIDLELEKVYLPKSEKKLPVYLTPKEVKSILDQCSLNEERGLLDYTMILVCYSLGLRVSELVGLRKDHIYLKGQYVKVFGKRRKERIIPLSEECASIMTYYLQNYRNKIKENPLLFFVHQDGKLVSRQYFFLRLKEYALSAHINKKISPHTLRHSFATALLSNGADLVQVKALLGHEDIKTTEIYTHLTQKKEKEEYDKAMNESRNKNPIH